ncbi:multiple sugar transport system substrate-binding protein [Kribbella sp. VKM Ac-2527]|uniref:Multiple sugar transport system substrate-binding protein n=1 Tax=Kribbella caucasensis TaxID=2512215 RepID=A0A4R6K9I9_9ACTN|nr:sugar ABC transporter substrate-binding protein [Kribbella sp. VKM Ac-2527]TDO46343.1 multiple sugar transport system substrate-binding protein [Kribbella sp. VKM Ac-2527]
MRIIKTAVAAAALTALLAACGQGSATKEAAAPDGKTTVRYMNFSANDGHEKDLTAIVNAFQTANPDITVQVETVPYANYFTKLQTAVAGGTAADAFELNYENFVTYAKNGSLAELKEVDAAAYKKSLYDAFTTDGKQYGVPESFSNVVLFYNKDLFKKAGVAEPNADWTWKDEQAAAEKLTNKGAKVWGDYQPVSYNEFYKVLAQTGGEFLNADRTEATFNSPQGVEAAKFLVGKVGKTMPTEADGAGTPDFDSKLFKSGKLAMWHTGIWMFSGMADAPFNWDVAVEPGNTQKASAMFVNGLVVNAASKNAEAAQKWITYLAASDKTTETRLATSWELPPVADEAKLAPYLQQPKPANRKAVFTALEETVLPPVIERQQEMQDIVTQELTSAAAGRKPVEKALADAQTKVNGLLKK